MVNCRSSFWSGGKTIKPKDLFIFVDMSFLRSSYPFDPSIKHHTFIGLGLLIWIFIFLYFTEPLDVSEFGPQEKLIYLPGYGLVGALMYLLFLPFQYFLYRRNEQQWFVIQELLFLLFMCTVSIFMVRAFYLYVVMVGEQNPYSFWYQLTNITLPAITTILPFVIIGRFAFGKYKEKKLNQQKIEIKGEGTYEGLRLLPDDLVCIQSSDNYIEVLYFSGKDLKKALIRNKLSVVSEAFPELIRTHRSYIINPYHFRQWKTEKGKFFIELSGSIFAPVSNTYKDKVKSVFNSATG